MRTLVLIPLLLVGATGCIRSTYTAKRYGTTLTPIMTADDDSARRVAVGEFTIADDALDAWCFGGRRVAVPDGDDYAEYVRNALIYELSIAGAYDATAETVIEGTLHEIDLDVSPEGGRWRIELTLSSTNGAAMTTRHRHTLDMLRYRGHRCSIAALELEEAVRGTLANALVGESFRLLVESWDGPWRTAKRADAPR